MKFPHNTDSFAYYLAGIAQIDDTRDYRVMLACKRASDYLSPAHRVNAELAFDLGSLDAANAIIDDCERAMAQHEARS